MQTKRFVLAAAIAAALTAPPASAQSGRVIYQRGTVVSQNANGDVVVTVTGFADSVKSATAAAVVEESRRTFQQRHPQYAASTETWVSLQAGTLTATTMISNIGSRVRDSPQGPSTPPPPSGAARPDIDRVSYSLDHNGWSRKTDYACETVADGHGGLRSVGWELISDRLTQSPGHRRACAGVAPDSPSCWR